MSDEKSIISLEQKAKLLDAAAGKFSNALAVSDSPFSSALTLSQGISALRELLDDGIMREIMKLAGSPLGFLTDRDHSEKMEPYKAGEVRDAVIEASLRGFRVAGNEFNIISSRFYAAKAGLHRRVLTYEGVTDFKETFDVPKLAGDKGAVVRSEATWKKNGVADKLTRDFAIRVNFGQGVDAIIGKAQRKLYAAVLNQLSGILTPDGEVGDISIGEAKVIDVKTPAMPTRPAQESKKEEVPKTGIGQTSPSALDLIAAKEKQQARGNGAQSLAEQVKAKLAMTPYHQRDLIAVLRENQVISKDTQIDVIDELTQEQLALVLNNWDDAVDGMRTMSV